MSLVYEHYGAQLHVCGAWGNDLAGNGWEPRQVSPLVILCVSHKNGGSERAILKKAPALSRCEVIQVPLEDEPGPPGDGRAMTAPETVNAVAWDYMIGRACLAGAWVAEALREGRDAWVVCGAGLNRSALVAGLALKSLHYDGADVVRRVQAGRPGALSNESFRRFLESSHRPTPAVSTAKLRREAEAEWWIERPLDEEPKAPPSHTFAFKVQALTGWHWLLSVFLPSAVMARYIAARLPYETCAITLPAGPTYEVTKGKGHWLRYKATLAAPMSTPF